MRIYLSHNIFLLPRDKIGIYDPPKMVPRQSLFKQFLACSQNLGFVAQGFEASKFLHKCEPPLLWSIVNCQFMIDHYGLQQKLPHICV